MDDGAYQSFLTIVERLLSSLNSLIKAIGLGILIAVAVLNFDVIQSGFRSLFEKMPQIARVSGFGLNAEFKDATEIGVAVKTKGVVTEDLERFWTEAQSLNALHGLKSLDKAGLIRLMNVGLLQDVCKFEKATSGILADNATDKALEEKQLVVLSRSPETLAAVRAKIKKREVETGKMSDIGYPLDCYNVTLTDKGRDVRTAIVSGLAAHFNPV